MADFANVIFAYTTELTSVDIDIDDRVLPRGAIVTTTKGGIKYLIWGDGVSEIKDLKRVAAGQIMDWGNITGDLTDQTDLMIEFAKKLSIAQGISNANKIVVTDASGDIVLVVNNFVTTTAFEGHTNNTNNPHAVSAGQTGAYTKQETDDAIAQAALALFRTDPAWEAASLAVLESWVDSVLFTAFDPINNRDVENYNIYTTTDDGNQYYFDSGTWFLFGPDISNFYTKSQINSTFETIVNVAAHTGNTNNPHATTYSQVGAIKDTWPTTDEAKVLAITSTGAVAPATVGGNEI